MNIALRKLFPICLPPASTPAYFNYEVEVYN